MKRKNHFDLTPCGTAGVGSDSSLLVMTDATRATNAAMGALRLQTYSNNLYPQLHTKILEALKSCRR